MNKHLIAAKLSQQDAWRAARAARKQHARGHYEIAIEIQETAYEWYARSRKWYEQGIESEDT